ncbi:uncharacterized protein N7498_009003 [Penicillium cinerascens]|uniref:Uncharacterized protein n=1 Tax=Penicillium cinerascens TaxID=70096 RepID=A0A9W9MAR4_9EURO|nr:uncharacterized protein N7498_009003 [Penicillium cinerascens]KAJ5195565.1 hypothetical protein N7498_009003 [Penicillium cinerascens]
MRFLNEVHNLFAFLFCRKQSVQPAVPSNQDQQNSEQAGLSNKEACSQGKSENWNNDRFGVLSEVAAPEPVEQPPDEERARIASLEQQLSTTARRIGRNEEDEGALSEIAAPQPVRRRSDEEEERHAFLERQIPPH